ncbi:hypothetical protein BH11CYA1_BH11CYA1_15420 [soil metagenome]
MSDKDDFKSKIKERLSGAFSNFLHARSSAAIADEKAAAIPAEPTYPIYFRLKTMVAVRVLAECTVLILLVFLPLVLLAFGKFAAISITGKIVLSTLALLAVSVLPVYGLITYKVKVEKESVTAYSLFKKRICRFALLKGLTRRSNWNIVRYTAEYEGGEISFPIWIDGCEKLVAIIREHLPKGASSLNPFRSFKQDPVALVFQIGQAVLSLIFIGVVWCFTVALQQSGQHSAADIGLLMVFAFIISAVLLWRAYVIALMPCSLEIKQEQFVVRTWFFEKNLAWADLKAVSEPYPLLPEGILIKTTGGSYLVGNGMDSADELEATLKSRISA